MFIGINFKFKVAVFLKISMSTQSGVVFISSESYTSRRNNESVQWVNGVNTISDIFAFVPTGIEILLFKINFGKLNWQFIALKSNFGQIHSVI